MQYKQIGFVPGAMIPKASDSVNKNAVARNAQNHDLASSFLLREKSMLKDLIETILKGPTPDQARDHWKFWLTQWRQNTINYIRNQTGLNHVDDKALEHYYNNFKYQTAVRLVEEYITRLGEKEKVKSSYPTVAENENPLLFGVERSLNQIHSRLMPYLKQLKDHDFSLVKV